MSPVPHIDKFELVEGDVRITAKKHFDENPHEIVALAIFDMDLYEPTKAALQAIKGRLTKGSVLVFDEVNAKEWGGETEALREELDLGDLRLKRWPHMPFSAYTVWGV